ncbi:MAG: hypothetical protein WC223_09080 [Bacteroidales bacterium]|jgi:hypothetical protein
MRTREFYVPVDSIIEFADVLEEKEITNTITGVSEDDEIVILVSYEKFERDAILELEDLLEEDEND